MDIYFVYPKRRVNIHFCWNYHDDYHYIIFSGSMSRSLSRNAIYTRRWFVSSILGQFETVVIPLNSILTFTEHFTSVSILHLIFIILSFIYDRQLSIPFINKLFIIKIILIKSFYVNSLKEKIGR